MFEGAIARETEQILLKLASNKFITDTFYLAGGTALALQFGHRESVDLDFFTDKFPKMEVLLQELKNFGLRIVTQQEKTLDVLIDEVKVSFLDYRYPMLNDKNCFGGFNLASVEDIAAMKLSAIMSRGSKKDFIDLYFLLESFELKDLIGLFREKYLGIDYDLIHLKKSLSFFMEADKEPMPKMIREVEWEKVKERVERRVGLLT